MHESLRYSPLQLDTTALKFISILIGPAQCLFVSAGVQFALVCPTEFDFLLDRWNPLQLSVSNSPEQWRLVYKWLRLWRQYFVWGFKYNSTLLQIILKVGFRKIFKFQFIFGDLRALEFERVDGVFPTFSSYIHIALLVSPSGRNQPKTTHNNDKIQIKRYFMIFISFWKRFEHKRKIPDLYYINHM